MLRETIIKNLIFEALSPHFRGRNAGEKLQAAVDSVVAALKNMPKEEPTKKSGVVVMTEQASMNKNSAPKTL